MSALAALAGGGGRGASSHQTHEMTVPNEIIGCVIGKGGSKIAEIRWDFLTVRETFLSSRIDLSTFRGYFNQNYMYVSYNVRSMLCNDLGVNIYSIKVFRLFGRVTPISDFIHHIPSALHSATLVPRAVQQLAT